MRGSDARFAQSALDLSLRGKESLADSLSWETSERHRNSAPLESAADQLRARGGEFTHRRSKVLRGGKRGWMCHWADRGSGGS